jgi:hypothetical protein
MKDGGSAFPWVVDLGDKVEGARGMTLLDFFAAHAPAPDQTWIHQYALERGYKGEAKMIADWRYQYARAMLEAREQ